MGLIDKFMGKYLSGVDDPKDIAERNSNSSVEKLNDDVKELFDGKSSEDKAFTVLALDKDSKAELLRSDQFLENHWSEIAEEIEQNEKLERRFGLDGSQRDGEYCDNHGKPQELGRQKYDRYESAGRDTTEAQTITEAISGRLELNSSVSSKRKGTQKNAATAREEIKSFQYCQSEPNDCPTTNKSFFYAAEEEYSTLDAGIPDRKKITAKDLEQVKEDLGPSPDKEDPTSDGADSEVEESLEVGDESFEESTAAETATEVEDALTTSEGTVGADAGNSEEVPETTETESETTEALEKTSSSETGVNDDTEGNSSESDAQETADPSPEVEGR